MSLDAAIDGLVQVIHGKYANTESADFVPATVVSVQTGSVTLDFGDGNPMPGVKYQAHVTGLAVDVRVSVMRRGTSRLIVGRF
jgi:hypothetical protein